MLRAHHLAGPALDWLLSLPAEEGMRVWLISPRPLPRVADLEGGGAAGLAHQIAGAVQP